MESLRSSAKLFLISLCFIVLFSAQTFAQQQVHHASKQLAAYYYKEIVENADSATKGLPLVITLHWMGASPSLFEKYIRGFSKPVRILLVEAPYPFEEGFSFYSISPRNYYDLPADEKMTILLSEGEKLSKFIVAATKLYVPKRKPIIVGASQGGDLSYVIGIRYPHLISQACPLLATTDNRIITSQAKLTVRNVPIDVFHGTADPIVPIGTVKEHVDTLQMNNYRVKLHTFDGVGHDISDAMKAAYIKIISTYL